MSAYLVLGNGQSEFRNLVGQLLVHYFTYGTCDYVEQLSSQLEVHIYIIIFYLFNKPSFEKLSFPIVLQVGNCFASSEGSSGDTPLQLQPHPVLLSVWKFTK